MRISLGLLLVLTVMASCDSITGTSKVPDTMAIKTQTATDEVWTRYFDNVDLAIVVPDGWETYNTDAGIVLNEYADTSSPDTTLRGILVHIFVPYLDRFSRPDSADANMAWWVLKQVVSDSDYVGDALVSEPVAFTWDQYDAAYYLLNNRNETVTMLLALVLPDKSNLVVCHISAPEDQSPRIRSMLPAILSSLRVNGTAVDPLSLDNLPDPLEFPDDPGHWR
jgi:hypothetical protein